MLTFDEDKHEYKYNGVVVPSVTQILSMCSSYKYVNKGLLDRASAFGNAVHLATELFDQGILDEDDLDENITPYLNGWKKYKADSGIKITAIEQRVYSRLGYAGTLDRSGSIVKQRTIVDIKTCTVVQKETALQLAGYGLAAKIIRPFKRVSVQLLPNDYKIHNYDDDEDFEIFKALLTVHKWKYPLKKAKKPKKKSMNMPSMRRKQKHVA